MRIIVRFLVTISILLPISASAATFTRSLSVGSRGAEVSALQQTLSALGFLNVAATGYFGQLTRQAVIAYQIANHLEPVGILGPKTRGLLNAYSEPESPFSSLRAHPSAPFSNASGIPPSPPAPVVASSSQSSASNALSVTLVSPPPILPRNTALVTFSVKTNKPANCRFGTQPGMTLSSMTAFQTSDGLAHTYTLNTPGSLYVYYVKCENANSPEVTPEMTVSISLSGTSLITTSSQLGAAASSQ